MVQSQHGGGGVPVDFSQYTDAKHYRIAEAEQARSFYGLLTLTPPGQETTLCAFTSCTRFSGRFRLSGGMPFRLEAVIDAEGLTLRPVERKSSMVQQHGIWVHQGQAPTGFDWDTIVDTTRDQQIKGASGL